MNNYIIGIDVGGTNVKFGLVNSRGQILARSRLNTAAFMRDKVKLIDAIAQEALDLMAQKKIRKGQVLGVGLGLPGFIDPTQGLVRFLPNIPGWHNVPLARILKKKLRLPVFIDNDVKLITLAEWRKGAGIGCRNFICITLGTGVGSGLVLDNKLYRGEDYLSGEIGHICYRDKTLERYVGNKVLQAKAAAIFGRKGMRLEDIFPLARANDAKAVRFWREVGEHIGFVLAGVVNLLNPALIVIGGGVSNNFRFFGPAVMATIKRKAIQEAASSVRVVRAQLGDDAGILGAFFLVKDSVLER